MTKHSVKRFAALLLALLFVLCLFGTSAIAASKKNVYTVKVENGILTLFKNGRRLVPTYPIDSQKEVLLKVVNGRLMVSYTDTSGADRNLSMGNAATDEWRIQGNIPVLTLDQSLGAMRVTIDAKAVVGALNVNHRGPVLIYGKVGQCNVNGAATLTVKRRAVVTNMRVFNSGAVINIDAGGVVKALSTVPGVTVRDKNKKKVEVTEIADTAGIMYPAPVGGGGGGGPNVPPTIKVRNVTVVNATTFTFDSIKVNSISIGQTAVAMTGTTKPYAKYNSATGTYTVELESTNPLQVGTNTISVFKSGHTNGTATANYAGITLTSGTIQGAIDLALPGETILVPAGTYYEQLIIDKDITVKGIGNVVIAGPIDYSTMTTIAKLGAERDDYCGLVMVKDNAIASLVGITIKGDPAKASLVTGLTHTFRYAGLILVGANAKLDNVKVLDITYTSSLQGMQNGFGIYAATTGNNTLTVVNSQIRNFNKSAFVIRAGYTSSITNNMIEGFGVQGIIGQNGIQFASKAIIKNNIIKNLIYNPNPTNAWSFCSVAIYPVSFTPSAGDIDGNVIDNVDNIIADKDYLASNTTHRVYLSQAVRVEDILNNSPNGTTVELEAGTYYVSAGYTVPSGVTVTGGTLMELPAGAIIINNTAELEAAIANQADGQTWLINSGNYPLNPHADMDADAFDSQKGWYFPITVNNLTIIGQGNPVLYGATTTINGAWASQNLITVFGDNVTFKGLTIMPKVETNKSIEVVGDVKFAIENCKFTPNTITAGASLTKGGSLYFNGQGKSGTQPIRVQWNTFNYTSVAFDGVEGSSILIDGNTFENIASGAYAIGNTYWGSAGRITTQYSDVIISGNHFKNVNDSTKIIAARLNQTFILDAANKVNSAAIDKNDFGKYINFNNLTYWFACKNNKVIVDDVTYESTYKDIDQYVKVGDSLQAAITAAAEGDTIMLAPGTHLLTSQTSINKGLTIIGSGVNDTILSVNTNLGTTNGSKHALSIYAPNVHLSNMTINSNANAYGVNAYGNANATLENVTLIGSRGAGLTVNGSTITATNLNTSGNAWGAVNVDPGSGVTTPSMFTLNSGTLAELIQIWSDGRYATATATVTVETTDTYSISHYTPGYAGAPVDSGTMWTKG